MNIFTRFDLLDRKFKRLGDSAARYVLSEEAVTAHPSGAMAKTTCVVGKMLATPTSSTGSRAASRSTAAGPHTPSDEELLSKFRDIAVRSSPPERAASLANRTLALS